MRIRTIELHERIKCPIPGIIVLLVLVRPTKRPGLEVGAGRKLRVVIDLRSPLDKEMLSDGVSLRKKKGSEYERCPHYSRIPRLRNRVRASTGLLQTMTRD